MSFAPPGESSFELLEERINFNSPVVVAFLYGFTVVLGVSCLYYLWRDRGKGSTQPWFYLAYTAVMFVLGTLHVVCLTRATQFEYVDDRNYPGGPLGFAANADTNPIFYTGATVYNITCILADGLLLWRTLIVFTGSSLRPLMFFPCLMYLATFSMSVVQIVEVHKPNGLNASFKFSLPFFVLSLSENVILSGSIALRLLVMRRRHVVVGAQHGSQYTSIAAMIIESAALYSVFNLCFIFPYIVGHPISGIFLDMLGQVQIIAPYLIIYRVARGRAWSSKTVATFSRGDIRFASAGVRTTDDTFFASDSGPTATMGSSPSSRMGAQKDSEKDREPMSYAENHEVVLPSFQSAV